MKKTLVIWGILLSMILSGLIYFLLFRSSLLVQNLVHPATFAVTSTLPFCLMDPTPPTTTPLHFVMQTVPFISQAPEAQWSDPIFQDGCEEASLLMAMSWAQGTPLSAGNATEEIMKLIRFEEASDKGYTADVSATDVADIARRYFNYTQVEVAEHVTATSLIERLQAGAVIVAPMNGQLLHNPYFTAPGPLYHMLLVIGYDPTTQEFITNDPGTRRGKGFRYSVPVFMNALRDYPSGHHEPITHNEKRVVIIEKSIAK